jgi:beta-lactamase regulating signal transducer with metallopeptidase domain
VDALFHIALSNAVVATALALVVAAVGLVCRRPAVMHALWLLVLVKLITPPLLSVPIKWLPEGPSAEAAPGRAVEDDAGDALLLSPDKEQLDDLGDEWTLFALPTSAWAADEAQAESQAFTSPQPTHGSAAHVAGAVGPVAEQITLARLFTRGTRTESSSAAQEVHEREPGSALAFLSLPWAWLAGVVWLAGSAVWFAVTALHVYRFQRLLRCARPAPCEMRIQAQRLSYHLGLSGCPGIWLVPGRLSPMIWALGSSSRLFVPSALWDRLNDQQRNALLIHELAHLRRRDHWVRGLEILVAGLYWWHPVVWWASWRMREAEEQCCDAWVVWLLPKAARAYATALVETVDFLSETKTALPAVASGIGHVYDLRRRLTMIMRGKTPRKLSGSGLVIVLGLGAFLLPILPTRAQPQPEEEQRVQRDNDEQDRREEQARVERQAKEAEERAERQRREAESRSERQRREAETRAGEQELRRAKSEVERFAKHVEQMQAELQRATQRLAQAKERLNAQQEVLAKRMAELRQQGQAEGARQPEAKFESRQREESRAGSRRGGSPDQEQRLRDVERKLDSLLREIQNLRREMRRPRPGAGNPGQPPEDGAFAAPDFDPDIPQPPQAPRAPRFAPAPPAIPGVTPRPGSHQPAPGVARVAPTPGVAPALPAIPTPPLDPPAATHPGRPGGDDNRKR